MYSTWTIWELYCECGKRGLVEEPFNNYLNGREELTNKLVAFDNFTKK